MLRVLCQLSVLLTLAGFVIFPHQPSHSFATYILGIIVLVAFPRVNAQLQHSPVYRAVLCLFVAALLSQFLSTGMSMMLLKMILPITFCLGVAVACAQVRVSQLGVFAWVGTVTVTALVMLAFDLQNADGRLIGPGQLTNPVVAAIYLSAGAVIAAASLRFTSRPVSVALLIVIPVLLGCVYLTQTRSVFVWALVVVVVVLTAGLRTLPWKVIFLGAVVQTMVLVFVAVHISEPVKPLFLSIDSAIDDGTTIFRNTFSQEKDLEKIRAGYFRADREFLMIRNDELVIASRSNFAVVFPAFKAEPEHTYLFVFRMRTDPQYHSNDGVYGRFMSAEADSAKAGQFLSMNVHRSEPDVRQATATHYTNIDNLGLHSTYQTYVARFKATDALIISPIIMKWWGLGNTPAYIADVRLLELSPGAWSGVDPTRLELLFMGRDLRWSLQLRGHLWGEQFDSLTGINWIWGTGFEAKNIELRNRNGFSEREIVAHSHNLFVALLVNGGLITLIAFIYLAYVTIRKALSGLDDHRSLIAVSMLLFGLGTLTFDGGDVVNKVDFHWLLVWLPIGLVLASHAKAPANQVSQQNRQPESVS